MNRMIGAASMSFDAMGQSAPAPNFGVLAPNFGARERNSGAAPPPERLSGQGQEPYRFSSSALKRLTPMPTR